MVSLTKLALFLAITASAAYAVEPCRTIRGRMTIYTADGQVRIWHSGTHHEFDPIGPDVEDPYETAIGNDGYYELFANFTVCPTEPFHQGAVQPVIVRSISNARVAPRQYGYGCQIVYATASLQPDGSTIYLRQNNSSTSYELDSDSVSHRGGQALNETLTHQNDVSADFTICPYEKAVSGKPRSVAVVKVEHATAIPTK